MPAPAKKSERGVTLVELLVAVTLLALLSVAMFGAMRIGLTSFLRADDKLMANRRAAGAQRILNEELEGLIPVLTSCGSAATGSANRMPFFQGEPSAMRLVSTFSLQEGARGRPQILEMQVIPGDTTGVRLVVNEIPYKGPEGGGLPCVPRSGGGPPQFAPIQIGPQSFVLADKLAYCRLSYLVPARDPGRPGSWSGSWSSASAWPMAIRVEMAPLQADASRVQPITVTAPIHLHRNPELPYEDRQP
jgi:general secretion pathway protein J